MVDLLTTYFLNNREVILPGIGQLQSIQMPARFDAARQLMLPPSEAFQWKPDAESTISPQGLMGFLSRQRHWTEEDSFEEVAAFCQQVKNELKEKGQWQWPGLGKLVTIGDGAFGFVPDRDFEIYRKSITARRVQHTERINPMLVGDRETNTADMQAELNAEEMIIEKNRWWIPAVIVGLFTLAVIIARLNGRL
jgi:hypothetical protein